MVTDATFIGHVDLGDGHKARLITRPGIDGRIYAVVVCHSKPDGSPCGGTAYLDVPDNTSGGWAVEQKWQVVSWEPLTLAPSFVCMNCGDHGFIREGKWVRA